MSQNMVFTDGEGNAGMYPLAQTPLWRVEDTQEHEVTTKTVETSLPELHHDPRWPEWKQQARDRQLRRAGLLPKGQS